MHGVMLSGSATNVEAYEVINHTFFSFVWGRGGESADIIMYVNLHCLCAGLQWEWACL